MAVSTLKGGENFDSFSKQVRFYAKLHGFQSVFDSDSYVEVGAEGGDRASLMAQGVTSSYVGEAIDGVGVSLPSFTDYGRPSYSSPQ